jgi:glutamate-1-semialdehyde 2,1-aminomutase
MFCLFLTSKPVRNLEDAKTANLEKFSQLFHSLLDQGIYIAPSQFETGFLSAAHTEADIEETSRALQKALEAIRG